MDTSIPAAKDGLIEALSQRNGLEGVKITRGGPKDLPEERQNVYLLGTDNISREDQQAALRERYDIRILIEVHVPTDEGDQEDVESGMWEIASEIDAQVQDEPQLASGVVDARFDLIEEESGFIREVWLARLRGAVHVQALV